MDSINTISLESNKQIKINFNGGDLSSDGGLLLIKEFASKIGLIKLVKQLFKTNDHTNCRIHTDPDNLMQMVYQIIASYFENDCADELTRGRRLLVQTTQFVSLKRSKVCRSSDRSSGLYRGGFLYEQANNYQSNL